jgi:hypothetical protein
LTVNNMTFPIACCFSCSFGSFKGLTEPTTISPKCQFANGTAFTNRVPNADCVYFGITLNYCNPNAFPGNDAFVNSCYKTCNKC